MRRQTIHSDNAPEPIAHYSQGMIGGGLIFVAGQVGVDAQGTWVGEDVASQTRQAIRNIGEILAAGGGSLEDVVRVFVYLVDEDDYAPMNEVYQQEMPQPFPPRSMVYVKLPGIMRIQIEAYALAPETGVPQNTPAEGN